MIRSISKVLSGVLVVAAVMTSCSDDKDSNSASRLVCVDGETIYACKTAIGESLVPVDFSRTPTGLLVEQRTTIDDFGNAYCVSLYSDYAGTIDSGPCSYDAPAPVAPPEVPLVEAPVLVEVVCVPFAYWPDGSVSRGEIKEYWSDGTWTYGGTC